VTDATPHPVYGESDQWPPEPGWGRGFLEQCGIDPDNPTNVREVYESCHDGHVHWLLTGEGWMDAEAYNMLVEAIEDTCGWEVWPLDWKPPRIVLVSEPFRNTLRRKSRTADADVYAQVMTSDPAEFAALVERTMQGLLGELPGRDVPGGDR
jgi:hypothetical protein